ncbi:MAG: 4Fe-4S binding protein [Treponema sp.]|jgi:MinD superfamily P-loop ATPase|nr:4Fe-4S binding protein [Treponema sp.]
MLKHFINFLFNVPILEKEAVKVHCEESKCVLCGKCQKVCHKKAITVDGRSWIYYSYRCNRCKACIGSCPAGALTLIAE